MLRKVRHPILFQGNLTKQHYFEGWYYKQVTADQETSLSFIPGVSLNAGENHCFIQYILVQIDENEKTMTHTGYVPFAVEDFHYSDDPFRVNIADASFTETALNIHLSDKDHHFQGEIQLGELHPIQTSRLQPNIMGVFGYIPKMECYHGVLSMKHSLTGYMQVNDERIDFNGGRGYIEKDWGTSFPKQYIWLHSNHFQNESASLFFSIAHIPFHFTEFDGFICNFVVNNKEYRFATYNRSRCLIEEISSDHVKIRLENSRARLELHAHILDQGELIAPVKGNMQKTIKEGISGVIEIRLEDKISGEIYEDFGRNSGVEIVDYH